MLAKAYQKYLYIPRPVSKRYPMDVQHRAKQFAPFAALRGFEEIVRKQEILYEQRKMLSEEQKCGLDRKLQMVSVGMKIQATYFKESCTNSMIIKSKTCFVDLAHPSLFSPDSHSPRILRISADCI